MELYDKKEYKTMEISELADTKILGYDIDSETGDHILIFECGCLQSGSLFRIFKDNKLKYTNQDDNQYYGLKDKILFKDECNNLLMNKVVYNAKAQDEIGDLIINVENEIRIEFIKNYSGYEPWQIYLKNGIEYIASGNKIIKKNKNTV